MEWILMIIVWSTICFSLGAMWGKRSWREDLGSLQARLDEDHRDILVLKRRYQSLIAEARQSDEPVS